MDSTTFRDLSVEEFDTTTMLEHATQQAIQRRYEDFFICDVDGIITRAALTPRSANTSKIR